MRIDTLTAFFVLSSTHGGVNLAQLGRNEHQLLAVHRVCGHRVALQVERLQGGQLAEDRLQVSPVLHLVVVHPEVLQLLQVLDVGEALDAVACHVCKQM